MEKNQDKKFLYCHFFIDSVKGIIKTIKLNFESFNLHVIELKAKIAKELESKKENTPLFKILSINKTILSPSLLDSVKISQFFENEDDIFCHVELNIQPIKSTNESKEEDKVLKYKTLNKYSFYEANKNVVKVLVPLEGIQNLPKENIVTTFSETSFEVKVNNLNGLNYMFAVPRLDAKIIPEKSEASVDKNGNIVIRLRKAKEDDHWGYLFKQRYVGE